ncbi:MAG TPA: asparagine synthase (glutamine-hydrolyzing) [Trebonia sp.]|nr:asparagine synthase (glutamine-hydrolyzing) [Trebonia sp.]
MCGLAGIALTGGEALPGPSDDLLRRMLRSVAHRGPDGSAFHHDGRVGLGFARLSLVDPVGGGQPLSTADGSLVLIANGEIYNHRELAAGLPRESQPRTGSDCEVLLYLYQRDGINFLDKVHGMFSFALWDRDNSRLIFARDRFGIKPLFYHQNALRIIFGSEIKALFEDPSCPRELDWETALSDQLLNSSLRFEDGAAHSWFKGIHLVPAASIMTFDLTTGSHSTHQYWSFPRFDGARTGGEDELVRRYGEILADSVADCGTADAEIGLFLSGGIDSASVAALAPGKPMTFTALNASTLANGDAEYGHRIAGWLGLANDQVAFDSEAVPTTSEWKRFLWLMETPLAGPEAFYKGEMYRYVRARYPHIKGMLLGGGADEFNGGYTLQIAAGGGWSEFTANLHRMAARGPHLATGLGAWWEHGNRPLVSASAMRSAAGGHSRDPYEMLFRWKYRDVQLYNCWHEDRSAAGSGFEARVPFLDHRLVEVVAAVPEPLRPALVWDKQILRRAMHGILPPQVTERPKIPFFYGDGVRYTYRMLVRMLAQGDGELADEALSGPGARAFLDAGNIRATLCELQADPGSGQAELVLRAINLGLLEQMLASLPAPPAGVAQSPVPRSVPVQDWDAEVEEIEAAVIRPASVDGDAVLALGEGVLLLNAPDDPATWYVVMDGTVEYVVDGAATPEWLALLRSLDGVRSTSDLLADLGTGIEPVEGLLSEALDLGVLTAQA